MKTFHPSLNLQVLPITDEENYRAAVIKLKRLNLAPYPEVSLRVQELLAYIDGLKKSDKEKLPVLTDVILKTHSLLKGGEGAISVKDYKDHANTMQGHSEVVLRILGAMLLAIGVAASVTIAIATGGFGVVAALPAVAGMVAFGFGLFAGRQTGFAKAIDNVGCVAIKGGVTEVTDNDAAFIMPLNG